MEVSVSVLLVCPGLQVTPRPSYRGPHCGPHKPRPLMSLSYFILTTASRESISLQTDLRF